MPFVVISIQTLLYQLSIIIYLTQKEVKPIVLKQKEVKKKEKEENVKEENLLKVLKEEDKKQNKKELILSMYIAVTMNSIISILFLLPQLTAMDSYYSPLGMLDLEQML